MDPGIVMTGGVKGNCVDGHFFPDLEGAEAAYSLTVFFYIGAYQEYLVLELGGGDTYAIVCQLNAGERGLMGGTIRIIDDQVDTGSFCL
jgi:hypothetical protein